MTGNDTRATPSPAAAGNQITGAATSEPAARHDPELTTRIRRCHETSRSPLLRRAERRPAVHHHAQAAGGWRLACLRSRISTLSSAQIGDLLRELAAPVHRG
jgi:hypothetical protein